MLTPKMLILELGYATQEQVDQAVMQSRTAGKRPEELLLEQGVIDQVQLSRATAERYGLDLTVVNPLVDPTWRFMTLDWDGKIRMDCSSPYAMAALIGRQHEFAVATGNDTDADRHGIVTPDAGLMNPNHFLAVAIGYLFAHRPQWAARAAVGPAENFTGRVRIDPVQRREQPHRAKRAVDAADVPQKDRT